MTNQIDQLPYYDPMIKTGSVYISDVWMGAFSAFIETLNGYLSDFGDFIPQLTTAQRNSIQAPVEGQIIYVTDATPGPPRTADLQVWQVKGDIAGWRSITTVP